MKSLAKNVIKAAHRWAPLDPICGQLEIVDIVVTYDWNMAGWAVSVGPFHSFGKNDPENALRQLAAEIRDGLEAKLRDGARDAMWKAGQARTRKILNGLLENSADADRLQKLTDAEARDWLVDLTVDPADPKATMANIKVIHPI